MTKDLKGIVVMSNLTIASEFADANLKQSYNRALTEQEHNEYTEVYATWRQVQPTSETDTYGRIFLNRELTATELEDVSKITFAELQHRNAIIFRKG